MCALAVDRVKCGYSFLMKSYSPKDEPTDSYLSLELEVEPQKLGTKKYGSDANYKRQNQ